MDGEEERERVRERERARVHGYWLLLGGGSLVEGPRLPSQQRPGESDGYHSAPMRFIRPLNNPVAASVGSKPLITSPSAAGHRRFSVHSNAPVDSCEGQRSGDVKYELKQHQRARRDSILGFNPDGLGKKCKRWQRLSCTEHSERCAVTNAFRAGKHTGNRGMPPRTTIPLSWNSLLLITATKREHFSPFTHNVYILCIYLYI